MRQTEKSNQRGYYNDEGLLDEGLMDPNSLANRDSLRLEAAPGSRGEYVPLPGPGEEKTFRCLFLRLTPAYFWVFFVVCLGSIAAGAFLLLEKDAGEEMTSQTIARDNIFDQGVEDPTLIGNSSTPTPVASPIDLGDSEEQISSTSLPTQAPTGISADSSPGPQPNQNPNSSGPPTSRPTPEPSSQPTSQPTERPTLRPTFPETVLEPGLTRIEALRALVLVDSSLDDLFDEKSDHYKALEWLAYEDQLQLVPSAENSSRIRSRFLLALLYFSLDGDKWRKSYNFLSVLEICDWNDSGEGDAFEGIRCGEDGEVVEIILDGNQLRGTIPTEIGLYNLRTLGLGTNSISGTIPTEIGNLSNIQTLNLGSNRLEGSLPSELGEFFYLQNLVLFDNRFEGEIPSSYGDLANLQTLYIEGAGLGGDIERLFCSRDEPYQEFYADCRGEDIECSCCTHCCNSRGAACVENTR